VCYTIYRAGLALQAIMPKAKTWKITLIVGSITTLAACFPALVMQLLDFVALYGLILMPMGAIIFIDYWVFPRIGLQSNLAESKNLNFNLAALITWIGSLLSCYLIAITTGLEIFFLGLPGWFLAAFLYILTSYFYQKRFSK
jgi:purine-cytosine permease-like protein